MKSDRGQNRRVRTAKALALGLSMAFTSLAGNGHISPAQASLNPPDISLKDLYPITINSTIERSFCHKWGGVDYDLEISLTFSFHDIPKDQHAFAQAETSALLTALANELGRMRISAPISSNLSKNLGNLINEAFMQATQTFSELLKQASIGSDSGHFREDVHSRYKNFTVKKGNPILTSRHLPCRRAPTF